MDGTNRKAIVRESLIWPNGLCIDYTLSRIYWADAKHHVIESSKFDGMDRKKVRRHSGDVSGKVREKMHMSSMFEVGCLTLHCNYTAHRPFVNTNTKART
jgi:sugar lactone lactonase YvrE